MKSEFHISNPKIYHMMALVDLSTEALLNKDFYDKYIDNQMKLDEEFSLKRVINDYHQFSNDYLFDPMDLFGPVYGNLGLNRFFIVGYELVVSKFYCSKEVIERAEKYGMKIVD